jgi:hypothetical protein
MEKTVDHRGYQLKRRPRRYRRLPQQQMLIDASRACGIHKGISKAELQDKMVNCIPRYFEEHKDDDKDLHGEAL